MPPHTPPSAPSDDQTLGFRPLYRQLRDRLMQRIAVPMIGGMVSSTALTLIVIPSIYAVVKSRSVVARPATVLPGAAPA